MGQSWPMYLTTTHLSISCGVAGMRHSPKSCAQANSPAKADTGARRPGDIGFASLRGGTAAGDHSVIFAGPHERLTLSDHAEDRAIFAHGALKAALWAHGKKPGLYTMADVLGLDSK